MGVLTRVAAGCVIVVAIWTYRENSLCELTEKRRVRKLVKYPNYLGKKLRYLRVPFCPNFLTFFLTKGLSQ